MERHRFDPLSFVFGVIFVTVAGVALLGVELFALRDLAWVLPALLVIVGAALLIGSAARRSAEHDETPHAAVPDVARAPEPAPSPSAPNVSAQVQGDDSATIEEPSDGEDAEVPRR